MTQLVTHHSPRVRAKKAPQTSVPFIEPQLPELSVLFDDFQKIYQSRTFSNGGQFERELISRMSAALNVEGILPVANATLGLIIAIRSLALPKRSLVLMPSFTFAATAQAVEWCGLEPIFCDAELEGWQASVNPKAFAGIADRVALIIPCNTFGAPIDLAPWKALSKHHGIPLLVDSAPGLGATYADGSPQGSAGVTEVFSMHATKPFAVGEGGLISTSDPKLLQTMRQMRNFGFDENRICQVGGLNAKLPEMQAAIACRVLDMLPNLVAHRRARAARYRDRLAPMGFTFQLHGECSAYQFMPVRTPDGVKVERIREVLSRVGVETRNYFSPALHQQPHFLKTQRLGLLRHTELLSTQMLSLPMSNTISEETVDLVCDAIELARAS